MNTPAASSPAWLPAGSARSVHWWSESALGRLRQVLARVVDGWSADWGLAGVWCEISCAQARPAAGSPGSWRALRRDGRDVAWLRMCAEDGASLLPALFPDAPRLGPIARSVAQECRRDALERMAACMGGRPAGEEAVLPEFLFEPLAGTVACEIGAPLGWHFVIAHALASVLLPVETRVAGQREPLGNALAALSGQPMQLAAEIEGCELSLGALQGLRAGDVVRLRHRLDRPAVLRDASGSAVGGGYLGRQGGQRALELAAA